MEVFGHTKSVLSNVLHMGTLRCYIGQSLWKPLIFYRSFPLINYLFLMYQRITAVFDCFANLKNYNKISESFMVWPVKKQSLVCPGWCHWWGPSCWLKTNFMVLIHMFCHHQTKRRTISIFYIVRPGLILARPWLCFLWAESHFIVSGIIIFKICKSYIAFLWHNNVRY